MHNISFNLFLITALLLFKNSFCDTPANCTYEDVLGTWTFYEGNRSGVAGLNCSEFSQSGSVSKYTRIDLLFPNVAVDQYGNKGHWTIIYNQGFEVTLNYRKYFAFSDFKESSGIVTSYCDRTLPGWSHDILGHNWACYVGKRNSALLPKVHHIKKNLFEENMPYKVKKSFVKMINFVQSSWKAREYPEYNNFTMAEILRRVGGAKSRIVQYPTPAPVTRLAHEVSKTLPDQFDWRNINGANFVSPVRNQGTCGSCYSFASAAMIESRLRIATNNSIQEVYSPQDVVSCSEYSQGCEGGFPYLIAGKYGQDFGLLPEQCNPYEGKDGPCIEKTCTRRYVADYGYVGGFYGGCNEEEMKIQLVKDGPIAVGFEVYPDFLHYAGGVYHHTGLTEGFNPFALTNHAVLVVGYGVDDQSGQKYWTVKNSWGTSWGENGYFRILRGNNECNIETLGVEATPIP